MENQIGTTIYEQIASVPVLNVVGIGSANFLQVAGAKDFVDIDNGLQFTVRVRGAKFNKIVVKLNASDTYDVEFWTCKVRPSFVMEKVDEIADIYAENLVSVLMSKARLA